MVVDSPRRPIIPHLSLQVIPAPTRRSYRVLRSIWSIQKSDTSDWSDFNMVRVMPV